ncbi:MAG: preprotein translocase subunit SecE [Lachnospiraceae bacterium]|nr:preprotein translocase subunit SecE [Lachnospiraceae bacterium]
MSKNEKTSSPSLKRSWFQELKAEFAKITWPTKSALAKKSTVALIVSIIVGLIIAGVDWVLKFGLDFIIG